MLIDKITCKECKLLTSNKKKASKLIFYKYVYLNSTSLVLI